MTTMTVEIVLRVDGLTLIALTGHPAELAIIKDFRKNPLVFEQTTPDIGEGPARFVLKGFAFTPIVEQLPLAPQEVGSVH